MRRCMLLLALCTAIKATTAAQVQLELTELNQVAPWGTVPVNQPIIWRSTQGVMEVRASTVLGACVQNCVGTPPPPRPDLAAWIMLDGRFYGISGNVEIYDSLILAKGTTTLFNCRRPSGAVLPLSGQIFVYGGGTQTVYLSNAGEKRWIGVASGYVMIVKSSSGDARCSGEVAGPPDYQDVIFRNGFQPQ